MRPAPWTATSRRCGRRSVPSGCAPCTASATRWRTGERHDRPPRTAGPVTSIKVKLGLLVAASVLVAAVLATLGAGTVPAWLSIPVTVLLALGVTQLLAIGMTSPLRQMTDAARRMAAGDYAVRVETGSTDEVGQLARAFNTDVGRPRHRRPAAARPRRQRLPRAAYAADRTGRRPREPRRRRHRPDPETVHVARAQAERLGDLVDDLLDLSRLDAGVVPLDRETCPSAAPGRGGRRGPLRTRREPARRHVRRRSWSPPDLVVRADRARLHQLPTTARQRRPAQPGRWRRARVGRVAATRPARGRRPGPGIAPQDRERVFERFGTCRTRREGVPVSGWRSPAGSRICTGGGSPSSTRCRERPVPASASSCPTTPVQRGPLPWTPPPTRPSHGAATVAPAAAATAGSGSLVDDTFGGFWPTRRPGTALGAAGLPRDRAVRGLDAARRQPRPRRDPGAGRVGVLVWLSPGTAAAGSRGPARCLRSGSRWS